MGAGRNSDDSNHTNVSEGLDKQTISEGERRYQGNHEKYNNIILSEKDERLETNYLYHETVPDSPEDLTTGMIMQPSKGLFALHKIPVQHQ